LTPECRAVATARQIIWPRGVADAYLGPSDAIGGSVASPSVLPCGWQDRGLRPCSTSLKPVTLTRMRLTEFWERMRAQFGEVYAESVAKDYVLSSLGNRTVDQALAEGTDAKTVWRAVCEAFKVPERQR